MGTKPYPMDNQGNIIKELDGLVQQLRDESLALQRLIEALDREKHTRDNQENNPGTIKQTKKQ
jgi:hypothetical protein